MRRYLPVLAALLWICAPGDEADAQTSAAPTPLSRQASAGAPSGVVGLVTDEAGQGIRGASVLAMGATLVLARTDALGRFNLLLIPGPYVLRATRDGYISTYREAVQVRRDLPLTRNITLLRAETPDVVLASMIQLPEDAPEPAVEPGRTPVSASDTAWRLRHLPRTVLRDVSLGSWPEDAPLGSPAGRAFADASSMASSGMGDPDFRGHVDFLTTSSLASFGDPATAWPRGVAYVMLGAPVGQHGDWSVRAAMAGGDAASWTFVGEYTSKADRPHAFRTGVTYSAQTMTEPGSRMSMASIDTVRRVGGVYMSDRWMVRPGLDIETGLNLDRYDYLSQPSLVSGHIGVRQAVFPGIALVAAATPRMVAPGADQFMPPATTGVWLPPERTFSALDPGGTLEPERVQYYEIGTDTRLKGSEVADTELTLRLRRFMERTDDQIATLFGLDDASRVGHYYISSPGGVEIDGWRIGLSGRVAPGVHATIDYSSTRATWNGTDGHAWLRHSAPSAARAGTEQLHDINTMVVADVPSTATQITMAVRYNSGFSRRDLATAGSDGRFAFEVRQQLPYRPLGRGELNLLLSARTLLHQMDDAGGFYDELLTVAPPVRLTCGLQMRF